ncbi:uncharacterized protein A4U43_C02F8730 [Asparagus officinalis]|uniref:Phytosulfokine n=1 Tax=Asparagus officinalis TaxID=4686 RepID=A0A5P1FHQ1_ASPOF|nr:putative phytosulfokines 6 [Asparagus officinalis]ONK77622.1 uncharacterized protein A4U43_C02F8730 [Asparagus officinalis]
MKRISSFHSLIILVVSAVVLSSLFVITKTAASRVSIAKPSYIPSAVHNTAQYHSEQGKDQALQAEMEGYDSLDLMGPEHCDDGDEECLRRRMTSEAHLDYIYTQHHKP